MTVSFVTIIFNFFAAFSIVLGLAMCWIFKERLDTSVRYWIAGTLLTGFAAGIAVYRDAFPPLVSIVLANALNFGGYFLFALKFH